MTFAGYDNNLAFARHFKGTAYCLLSFRNYQKITFCASHDFCYIVYYFQRFFIPRVVRCNY